MLQRFRSMSYGRGTRRQEESTADTVWRTRNSRPRETGLGLCMRWLWLQKTEPDRPWAFMAVQVPHQVQAMFAISVATAVGDGCNTKLWTGRWLHGHSIDEFAPALMSFICRRCWKSFSVADALQDNRWTNHITGGLPVLAVCNAFNWRISWHR